MSVQILNVFLTIIMLSSSTFAFLDEVADTQPISEGEWQSYAAKEFLKSPAGKMVNAGNSSSTPIMAETYREAVLSKDAPIAMIQELHKKSQSYWNRVLQSIDGNGQSPLIPKASSIRKGIVVSQLADLNLSAFRVWNAMVACNGNDPQKARIGFLHADDGSFCEGSPGQSEIALKKLKELAFNWQAFIFGIEATEDGFIADLRHSEAYQRIFQNMHPLLTEFTLLIWSSYFNTFNERRSDFMRITQTALLYFRSNSMPEIQAALKFNSAVSLFQGTMLIVYFMNYENYEHQCAVYGLWPALNRILLNPDRIVFFISNDQTGANAIKKRGNRICGEMHSINWEDDAGGFLPKSMFGLYSVKAYYHKVQMQLLYETYLRSQWDNRNALKKATDSAKPVVEDLGELFFSLPGPNILKGLYQLFNPSYF